MSEDMTYEPVQPVAQLAARVQELERELADMSDERAEAIMLMMKFQQERDELRAKLDAVPVESILRDWDGYDYQEDTAAIEAWVNALYIAKQAQMITHAHPQAVQP